MERFELLAGDEEWVFRGTILALSDQEPAEARYEIVCDPTFRTRRADITVRSAAGEITAGIRAENGFWWLNGREVPQVEGAIDIDLGWTPATNTLPIRRMGMSVGDASGEFIAAWVRFPGLTLESLSQEYCRLSENVYRYSSRGGAFTAELRVDEHGLVMDYQNFWKRAGS